MFVCLLILAGGCVTLVEVLHEVLDFVVVCDLLGLCLVVIGFGSCQFCVFGFDARGLGAFCVCGFYTIGLRICCLT